VRSRTQSRANLTSIEVPRDLSLLEAPSDHLIPSLSILYHSESIQNGFGMDNIHPIDLPSWETGLHSDGILYPEPPSSAPDPDPEIDVMHS
jgi:hypothetical protein